MTLKHCSHPLTTVNFPPVLLLGANGNVPIVLKQTQIEVDE